ncbi:unnamed protein product [Cylicocyclus nassatus]|uniref:Protein kinase domain-containing protein n=1 Tax=Cylicocyclus nassatus TaxID=53992 RepID=A0AA36GPD5_CYLNA|nr:unnamed protein product [Cylicocyclus nassatus]
MDDQPVEEMMLDMPKENEDVIRSRTGVYVILERLGKGAFGAVFRVRRVQDNSELAMKCESCKSKRQIIKHEAKVFESLKQVNSPHFLHLLDRGKVTERFNFIVMKLLGKNLWDLRVENMYHRFSLVTAIRAGEQTLAGIRDLHICGYIHRDIKPTNFAVGREEDGDQHTIYILDFGLSRQYRSSGKDLRYQRVRAAFRGTARYASIAALNQKEQSRKDDVESWWYMVVEWTTGYLPWRHCKGVEKDAVINQKIQIRERANLEKILEYGPVEYMLSIILYIDTLNYASIPDYDHIAAQLEAASEAYNLKYADPPEWDTLSAYLGPRYEKNVPYELKCKDIFLIALFRSSLFISESQLRRNVYGSCILHTQT